MECAGSGGGMLFGGEMEGGGRGKTWRVGGKRSMVGRRGEEEDIETGL